MQFRPIGGKPHLLTLLHIDRSRQLDDDRLARHQAFDVEQRHFAERFDDRNLPLEEVVIAMGDLQVLRADPETCPLVLLGCRRRYIERDGFAACQGDRRRGARFTDRGGNDVHGRRADELCNE
jgi:hypothetical protein